MTENSPADSTLRSRVLEALDQIRPYLQNDGGDVELVDAGDDGVVQVRFLGACCGCPHARMTLTHGIKRSLQQMIPEVKQVVLV